MKNGLKIALKVKDGVYSCTEEHESQKEFMFKFRKNEELDDKMNDAMAYRAIALHCLHQAYNCGITDDDIDEEYRLNFFMEEDAYKQLKLGIEKSFEEDDTLIENRFFYSVDNCFKIEKYITKKYKEISKNDICPSRIEHEILMETNSIDPDNPDLITLDIEGHAVKFTVYKLLEHKDHPSLIIINME